MKISIEKMLPPGADRKIEITSFLVLLLIELGISLTFLPRLFTSISSLYITRNGKRILMEGAIMPTFQELMQGNLLGLLLLCFGCIAMVLMHYVSFYRESKSIYVMKRIDRASVLHKSCFTLPVLCFLCGLGLAGLLVLIYSLLYYHLPPAHCLPMNDALNLWRCIL